MWFSAYCTLIDNDKRQVKICFRFTGLTQSVEQDAKKTREEKMARQDPVLTTVMMHTVVDKSTDNAKPHSLL